MKKVSVVLSMLSCVCLLLAWHAPAPDLAAGLSPERPASYLDIGEQLAARAMSDDQVRLAQQVLAIGIGLNVDRGDAVSASSCCIALADTISADPRTQQMLWDLALTLSPDRLSAWAERRGEGVGARADAAAAECVRLARNAKVDEASDLLKQRSVRQSIERACISLGFEPELVISELELMLRSPTRDPCRGQVFESIVQDGTSSRVICDAHQYPIATAPNAELLSQLIAIELLCMQAQGSVSEWGGVVAMGLDAPLRDPEVKAVYQQFGVDPLRPYLRDGRWTSQP